MLTYNLKLWCKEIHKFHTNITNIIHKQDIPREMKLVWSPDKASKAYLDTVKSVSLSSLFFVPRMQNLESMSSKEMLYMYYFHFHSLFY